MGKAASNETKSTRESRRLNWKDVMTIITSVVLLSGVTMSIVGWVHAEVTIPKILNKTSEQIKEAISEHSKYPHPVSASRREFEMLKSSIDESIDDFKQDARNRLNRIEQKLDNM